MWDVLTFSVTNWRDLDEFDEIRVDLDPGQRQHMMDITGRRTVPQIFIGQTHVGGCDDLIALDGRGGHPKNIVMLTCDAFGVLPPISRLTPAQAMYHFLSGYTARVAGTERGVTEPKATFSTCFGAPFLPLSPNVYATMLGVVEQLPQGDHCHEILQRNNSGDNTLIYLGGRRRSTAGERPTGRRSERRQSG